MQTQPWTPCHPGFEDTFQQGPGQRASWEPREKDKARVKDLLCLYDSGQPKERPAATAMRTKCDNGQARAAKGLCHQDSPSLLSATSPNAP